MDNGLGAIIAGLATWFFFFKAKQSRGREFSNNFMAEYFGEGSFLSLFFAKIFGIFWGVLAIVGFFVTMQFMNGSSDTNSTKALSSNYQTSVSSDTNDEDAMFQNVVKQLKTVKEPAEGVEVEDVPVSYKCGDLGVVIYTNYAYLFGEDGEKLLKLTTEDFNKYSYYKGKSPIIFNLKESNIMVGSDIRVNCHIK
jgi:hypothetical protein